MDYRENIIGRLRQLTRNAAALRGEAAGDPSKADAAERKTAALRAIDAILKAEGL